jgi:hypothetical protein
MYAGLENMRSSTSHSLVSLYGLSQDLSELEIKFSLTEHCSLVLTKARESLSCLFLFLSPGNPKMEGLN